MQSYIGVLARTTIPIIFDDWRNVDDEPKEKIWEAIQVIFFFIDLMSYIGLDYYFSGNFSKNSISYRS